MKNLSRLVTRLNSPTLLFRPTRVSRWQEPGIKQAAVMATSNDSNAQHKRERASSGTPDAPSKRRSNLDGDDDDNVSLDPDEAITKEELRGTEVPMKPPKPRDACTNPPFLPHIAPPPPNS